MRWNLIQHWTKSSSQVDGNKTKYIRITPCFLGNPRAAGTNNWYIQYSVENYHTTGGIHHGLKKLITSGQLRQDPPAATEIPMIWFCCHRICAGQLMAPSSCHPGLALSAPNSTNIHWSLYLMLISLEAMPWNAWEPENKFPRSLSNVPLKPEAHHIPSYLVLLSLCNLCGNAHTEQGNQTT